MGRAHFNWVLSLSGKYAIVPHLCLFTLPVAMQGASGFVMNALIVTLTN
jgi:hypothetical protein